MPATQDKQKIQEDGEEKDAVIVRFTNGAKQQIESLKEYYKANEELDVVKLGISVLQKMRELEEKKAQEKPNE
ncbi:MAG TPA: hypothetical protein VG917_03180 [Patescibacteria group bacterium]|nr:hypothetical protein [Patescibacteria group bacterium]